MGWQRFVIVWEVCKLCHSNPIIFWPPEKPGSNEHWELGQGKTEAMVPQGSMNLKREHNSSVSQVTYCTHCSHNHFPNLPNGYYLLWEGKQNIIFQSEFYFERTRTAARRWWEMKGQSSLLWSFLTKGKGRVKQPAGGQLLYSLAWAWGCQLFSEPPTASEGPQVVNWALALHGPPAWCRSTWNTWDLLKLMAQLHPPHTTPCLLSLRRICTINLLYVGSYSELQNERRNTDLELSH